MTQLWRQGCFTAGNRKRLQQTSRTSMSFVQKHLSFCASLQLLPWTFLFNTVTHNLFTRSNRKQINFYRHKQASISENFTMNTHKHWRGSILALNHQSGRSLKVRSQSVALQSKKGTFNTSWSQQLTLFNYKIHLLDFYTAIWGDSCCNNELYKNNLIVPLKLLLQMVKISSRVVS